MFPAIPCRKTEMILPTCWKKSIVNEYDLMDWDHCLRGLFFGKLIGAGMGPCSNAKA